MKWKDAAKCIYQNIINNLTEKIQCAAKDIITWNTTIDIILAKYISIDLLFLDLFKLLKFDITNINELLCSSQSNILLKIKMLINNNFIIYIQEDQVNYRFNTKDILIKNVYYLVKIFKNGPWNRDRYISIEYFSKWDILQKGNYNIERTIYKNHNDIPNSIVYTLLGEYYNTIKIVPIK